MKGSNFPSKSKLTIYLGLLALVVVVMIPAHADQVVQPTSGGTLDIGFSTNPANPTLNSDTYLMINFIDKSTHQLLKHIDYKVSVMEGDNQICGTGAKHIGDPAAITNFECQFPDAAKYQVIVEVDGILFNPIPPETATFTVDLSGSSSNSNPPPNSNTTSPQNSTQNIMIPSWVKKTAGWWASGQVGDQDFVKGIQYLIQQGIMQIPTQSNSSATNGAHQIPSWVKNTAKWWSDGQVGDQDFVKGIQWLVSNGIIIV
ncbi:MAG: hypothetical protein KGH88_00725 [Thaumarchaeota archaeon]|nr:hypothetical protein [Nitrososphaerota archaeon]